MANKLDSVFDVKEYRHMVVTIEWAREMAKYNREHGKKQVLFENPKGTPLNYDQVFAYLDILERKGYSCVPQCTNSDEFGICKGHTAEDKQ